MNTNEFKTIKERILKRNVEQTPTSTKQVRIRTIKIDLTMYCN